MDTSILESLNPVFRRVFDSDELTVTRQTTASDVEEWDSLTHINLIVAVEKEFKVRFTTAEVSAMTNVGDLVDLILKKTA